MRLLTVIPPVTRGRLSLSTIPEGAILTHTVGRGDGVTVTLSTEDAEEDACIDADTLSEFVIDELREDDTEMDRACVILAENEGEGALDCDDDAISVELPVILPDGDAVGEVDIDCTGPVYISRKAVLDDVYQ